VARKPPKSITVLVDSREQHPLLFPESTTWYPYRHIQDPYLIHVETKVKELVSGDYCLEDHDGSCLIERKGSFSELCSNLWSKDYKRAHGALERFSQASDHPYLLLEESVSNMMQGVRYLDTPAELIFDAFLCELMDLGIQIIWTGKRASVAATRSVGTMILHVMLNHAFHGYRKSFAQRLDAFQKVG
jgi:ERCC4-type nuclease